MENDQITIAVKHLSSKVYEITISAKATVDQLKMKVSEESKIEKNGIKLIFRGKILKDNSVMLSDLNITTGHTIHMVKDKSKTAPPKPSGTGTSTTTAPPPQSNQTGSNPFAQANAQPGMFNPGAFGQGMGGLGGLGGNMDLGAMQNAMQNPQMREMVQGLMANPEALRNMINSNPMLQQMTQNNPQLQAMLDNPDMMRNMSNMMSSGNIPGFPMNPGQTPNTQTSGTNPPPQNPTSTTPTPNQTGTTPPPQMPNFPNMGGQMPDFNAMMSDPAFMARMNQFRQNFMNNQGGNPGTTPNMGGMGGFGGLNAPIPPQNVTNPEETYKDQLKQLEGMGFTNKELNIAVLKQTYGNVQMAIEKLLNM